MLTSVFILSHHSPTFLKDYLWKMSLKQYMQMPDAFIMKRFIQVKVVTQIFRHKKITEYWFNKVKSCTCRPWNSSETLLLGDFNMFHLFEE